MGIYLQSECIILLLTELEVYTRKYLFWHSRRMDRTLRSVHKPWMSEQIFPVWTEVSVNKCFIAAEGSLYSWRWAILLIFCWHFCEIAVSFVNILNQSPRRSSSVRVSIVWKRQLIDGQTFSSRSEKWQQSPKFCMQHETRTQADVEA